MLKLIVNSSRFWISTAIILCIITNFNKSIAGENDIVCDEKIPKDQCARLIKAIRSWNDLFGRDISITNSKYIGPVNSSKASSLAYELTDLKSLSQAMFPKIRRPIIERDIIKNNSLKWIPKEFDDNQIEANRVDIYRLMENKEWRNGFNKWKERLELFINTGKNNQVVQLEWQDREGKDLIPLP